MLPEGVTSVALKTGILKLIVDASPVAKLVLVILLLFSIASWAVIADRWRLFRRARQQSRRFFRAFRSQRDLRQLHREAAAWPASPAANVFREVFGKFANPVFTGDVTERTGLSSAHNQAVVEAVYRELDRASHAEMAKLEKGLTVLATTGSVSPFFGLFGTVWGIMSAFINISAQGSTNIVAVAPGIAEALIATAAGLAAAIPAVMAYNHFLHRIREMGLELEDLSTSLLTIVQMKSQYESV
ncbi:MAG: MotA/TolQ/ExbB proton channel family protein [Candidatus Latescibacteria bacterium]|nr:MotA/TolQ/ExbB proton channel family protein [Candidatus Latescibacterota bacterium]